MQLRERFTSRARDAILLATQEAARLKQEIDTGHILQARFNQSSGAAGTVLRSLGLHAFKIAFEIDKVIAQNPFLSNALNPVPSAAAKRVIENAIDEAQRLNHDYVGTEHLLIGLMRETEGVAARVLCGLGLSTDTVRDEVQRLTSPANGQTRSQSLTATPADPLTDAEHKFFIDLYRSAVDFYKPKIEAKTGVFLGDIYVWDYSCLQQHQMDRFAGLRLFRAIKQFVFGRPLRQSCEPSLTTYYTERARRCAASYYRNAIYVSFVSGTHHEEAIAQVVVHELSHALWEKIAGESIDAICRRWKYVKAKNRKKFALLVEGFATYAEIVWFLDVYPSNIREAVRNRSLPPDSVYLRGFCRIEELVKQHGQQVLLEIPKRWRSC